MPEVKKLNAGEVIRSGSHVYTVPVSGFYYISGSYSKEFEYVVSGCMHSGIVGYGNKYKYRWCNDCKNIKILGVYSSYIAKI